MKFKSFFISNSSTSSFLIVGFKVPVEQVNTRDMSNEDLDKFNNEVVEMSDGYIYGQRLKQNKQDLYKSNCISWSIPYICETAKEVAHKYNKPLEEIQLFNGIESI